MTDRSAPPEGNPSAFMTITTRGLSLPGSGYSGADNDFKVQFAPLRRRDPALPMHVAVIRASWDSKNATAGDLCIMTCGQVVETRNGLTGTSILFSSTIPADGTSEVISEVPSGVTFTPMISPGIEPLTELHIALKIAANGVAWPTQPVAMGNPTRLTLGFWNAVP